VERPGGADAGLLDHPLEHREQQGDEAQKHELCIAAKERSCSLYRVEDEQSQNKLYKRGSGAHSVKKGRGPT
jgi:hypothetical protein